MKRHITFTLSLAALGLLAGNARAQSNLGSLLSGKGGLSQNNVVSVTMTDPVDSNAGAIGRSYRATLAKAATVGTVSVPQGSLAVVTLQKSGTVWSVALSSVSAGGSAIPVSSSMASLAGGKIGGLSDAIGNLGSGGIGNLGSIFGGKSKTQETPKSAVPLSASGNRVYLPAGTQVAFLLNQSTTKTNIANSSPTGQSGGVAETPAQGQTSNLAESSPSQNPDASTNSQMEPPAQSAQPAQSSNSVVWKNIQYQLQACRREAPHIICEVIVTNVGPADNRVFGHRNTYYIDQSGNRMTVNEQRVANCDLGGAGCEALPGVKMTARYVFTDETGESKTLVRLQLWGHGEAVAQFQNVPVQ